MPNSTRISIILPMYCIRFRILLGESCATCLRFVPVSFVDDASFLSFFDCLNVPRVSISMHSQAKGLTWIPSPFIVVQGVPSTVSVSRCCACSAFLQTKKLIWIPKEKRSGLFSACSYKRKKVIWFPKKKATWFPKKK